MITRELHRWLSSGTIKKLHTSLLSVFGFGGGGGGGGGGMEGGARGGGVGRNEICRRGGMGGCKEWVLIGRW